MNKCVITALATPFKKDKIDVNSYVKLCRFQQENNVSALLALGTTAETQLLSDCERKLLLRLAKAETTLPVIAGIEEASTTHACKRAEQYAELGANALMVAPPSFCKCTPLGYVKHVTEIKRASGLPIILYNIPSRCAYGLDLNAVKKLAETGCAEYVKDSSSNADFAKKAPYVKTLCGSDERLKQYLDAGAQGVVSATANVSPKITRLAVNGDKESQKTFSSLAYLAMLEINPISVKYMLYKAGIFESYDVRLPLTKANAKTRKTVDAFWQGGNA